MTRTRPFITFVWLANKAKLTRDIVHELCWQYCSREGLGVGKVKENDLVFAIGLQSSSADYSFRRPPPCDGSESSYHME